MKKERLCLDCGCYFTISLNDIKKLRVKGKCVPTHCPVCRERRWKEERQSIRRAKKFERKFFDEQF